MLANEPTVEVLREAAHVEELPAGRALKLVASMSKIEASPERRVSESKSSAAVNSVSA